MHLAGAEVVRILGLHLGRERKQDFVVLLQHAVVQQGRQDGQMVLQSEHLESERPRIEGIEHDHVAHRPERWIDAPPLPGALLINIGDMVEIWTNGAFVATSHRVRPVKQERFSFPLFFAVDYSTEVKPLPRFVTRERPARKGLIAGEHLFAQTALSFNYQKARLAKGEIKLPETYVPLSSFGQGARYAGSDQG